MPSRVITSRQNPRVKEAALLRNRRQREQLRQTLVYGARETLRALKVGAVAQLGFVCPERFPHEESHTAAKELRDAGVETLEVSPEVFEKLAYGDRYDGVVAVVDAPPRTLEALKVDSPHPLIAVIEGVEKPGNLGALLRTADGAGVDAVLVADPVIDLYNPNAIRASVATIFKPNVAVATAQECQAWLAASGVPVYATRPDAQQTYWKADFASSAAIIFGAEAQGLTDAWSGSDVTPIALPMLGVGDSLNVSATAAVLLYEARRQRGV